jgi:hypothetical protein
MNSHRSAKLTPITNPHRRYRNITAMETSQDVCFHLRPDLISFHFNTCMDVWVCASAPMSKKSSRATILRSNRVESAVQPTLQGAAQRDLRQKKNGRAHRFCWSSSAHRRALENIIRVRCSPEFRGDPARTGFPTASASTLPSEPTQSEAGRQDRPKTILEHPMLDPARINLLPITRRSDWI